MIITIILIVFSALIVKSFSLINLDVLIERCVLSTTHNPCYIVRLFLISPVGRVISWNCTTLLCSSFCLYFKIAVFK